MNIFLLFFIISIYFPFFQLYRVCARLVSMLVLLWHVELMMSHSDDTKSRAYFLGLAQILIIQRSAMATAAVTTTKATAETTTTATITATTSTATTTVTTIMNNGQSFVPACVCLCVCVCACLCVCLSVCLCVCVHCNLSLDK